jgi:hypothetical protein
MDCVEQQGSSWNQGGIITDTFPVFKTVDTAVDRIEFDLDFIF